MEIVGKSNFYYEYENNFDKEGRKPSKFRMA